MTADSGLDSQRYVLQSLSDGGVLLDLDSGALFELNHSAAFIWSRAVSGVPGPQIAIAYALAFGVDHSVAHADVATTLAAAPAPPLRVHADAETHYELRDDRYRFSVAGTPQFEILSGGHSIRCLNRGTPTEIYRLLRPLSPKLLALLGAPVLHASAVRRRRGETLAFVGASGAGKTTTARAFRAAGFELLSEDKVVLRQQGSGIGVVPTGERNIDAWVRETALRLAEISPGDWCELGGLEKAAGGDSTPLDRVILLDADRRAGRDLHFVALGPSAAATSLFRNGFYGSYSAADWTRSLDVAITITRCAPSLAATVPHGDAALQEAVLRYAEITQS